MEIYSFILLRRAKISSKWEILVELQEGTSSIGTSSLSITSSKMTSMILPSCSWMFPSHTGVGLFHRSNRTVENHGVWLRRLGDNRHCHFCLLSLRSIALREANTHSSYRNIYVSKDWEPQSYLSTTLSDSILILVISYSILHEILIHFSLNEMQSEL